MDPTALAARNNFDTWITPPALALAIVKSLRLHGRLLNDMGQPTTDAIRVLDPGMGTGNFGNAVREVFPNAYIVGVEVRSDSGPIPASYNEVVRADFVQWSPDEGFDLIIGNPPYSKPYNGIAERFIHHAIPMLRTPDATLCFLLRLGFWATQDRYDSLWAYRKPLAFDAFPKRPSFGLNKHGKAGTDGQEYAAYFWDRYSDGNVQTVAGHLAW